MKTLSMGVLAPLLLASAVQARPVTYPGGSMSMTELDGNFVISQVDHTLNRKLAVGVYGVTENGADRYANGVLANFLVMRQNKADSQANLYLMGGIGPSWVRRRGGSGRDTKPSGFIGAEADWETRRFFVGASAKASFVGADTEIGWRTRLGIAPYVANSGAVHTWLMLQVGRSAIPGRKTDVTPLIRLFKGPVLGEFGVSHRGRAFGTLWFYF